MNFVLHSAALKQVGLREDSPNEVDRTNNDSTQKPTETALPRGVERVIFRSSGKAGCPTIEGRLEAHGGVANKRKISTIFASTRFGNILDSPVSVVPILRGHIAKGGLIALTDRVMTPFNMSLRDATALVLPFIWLASGGEVTVTEMPVIRIEDIAAEMRDAPSIGRKIEIIEIGAKPGEKMYEELINAADVTHTCELNTFFVIKPPFANHHHSGYAPYNFHIETSMAGGGVQIYLESASFFS